MPGYLPPQHEFRNILNGDGFSLASLVKPEAKGGEYLRERA